MTDDETSDARRVRAAREMPAGHGPPTTSAGDASGVRDLGDGLLIRPLTVEDVDLRLAHVQALVPESGRDGTPLFAPYGRDDPYPVDTARASTLERWTRSLDVPRWGRSWGVFDGDALVGDGELHGGDLRSLLHRTTLGMGLRRSHCGRGLGRALLTTLVDWAVAQPILDWIDLGVFEGNAPARALYRALGFVETGRAVDRFRVDGAHVTDISMTLDLRARRA
ncbi:MAG: GNAT family N-acetyltransferase [Planctomycetes bacterium]|nr:GNAT family N-acetyltransferase [Planctomycetota bacterium]